MKPNLRKELGIKIFVDGSDLHIINKLTNNPLISGFTTNPSLMKKSNVMNYKQFAVDVLDIIPHHTTISFEVLADDLSEMERQAKEIASWGNNIYVKIPITNTLGESTAEVIKNLSMEGIKTNVTAVMTLGQVAQIYPYMVDGPGGYISIFCGRIADTGIDPVPIMKEAVEMLKPFSHLQLLWASSREVLNIFQADQIGCDIITVTYDLLQKLDLYGKDLEEYSLETVKMFYNDAQNIGLSISHR